MQSQTGVAEAHLAAVFRGVRWPATSVSLRAGDVGSATGTGNDIRNDMSFEQLRLAQANQAPQVQDKIWRDLHVEQMRKFAAAFGEQHLPAVLGVELDGAGRMEDSPFTGMLRGKSCV